jgi:hypothetical protein
MVFSEIKNVKNIHYVLYYMTLIIVVMLVTSTMFVYLMCFMYRDIVIYFNFWSLNLLNFTKRLFWYYFCFMVVYKIFTDMNNNVTEKNSHQTKIFILWKYWNICTYFDSNNTFGKLTCFFTFLCSNAILDNIGKYNTT